MTEISRLLAGYRSFRQKYFVEAGVGRLPLLQDDGRDLAAGCVHELGELLHGDLCAALRLVHRGCREACEDGAFFFLGSVVYGDHLVSCWRNSPFCPAGL